MIRTVLCLATLAVAAPAAAQDWKQSIKDAAKVQANAKLESTLGLAKPAPAGAAVYFINLKDGDTVKSPVLVQFGLKNAGVAPAGTQGEAIGHHHLLINEPAFDPIQPLPMTEQIKHFGGGQTETTLTLKPGKHTLQLLFADWKHQPFNPSVQSSKITITVK
jgi:hypothetical protein